MNLVTSIDCQPGNPEPQDRVEVLRLGQRIVIIVADGSGGISGGGQAADFVMAAVRDSSSHLTRAEECGHFLEALDQKISASKDCGETTATLIVLQPGQLFGANVGDSAAWLFMPHQRAHLTMGRSRKPFLGSGAVLPHIFSRELVAGKLVVATDGLWKYASLESIERNVRSGTPERLAQQLVELVRLPSGTFQDDVTVATCMIAA